MTSNPRKLFLIDGLGAILSSFLLGVVLVQFEPFFGIPVNTLYILASIPVLFAVYDFVCFSMKPENYGPFLKGIAAMNTFYCFLSIGLVLSHIKTTTVLGWIYILLEIVIVLALARIELKAANAPVA